MDQRVLASVSGEVEANPAGDAGPGADAVLGVVLAGGRGRRLGRDKALLRLPGMRNSLLEHAVAVLEQVVPEVRVSCAPDMPGRSVRPVIPDLRPGEGALRAVHSVLSQTGRPCLIIPCDMPLLTPELLRALLKRREALLRSLRGYVPPPSFLKEREASPPECLSAGRVLSRTDKRGAMASISSRSEDGPALCARRDVFPDACSGEDNTSPAGLRLGVFPEDGPRGAKKVPLLTAWKSADSGMVETLAAIYEPEGLPWFARALAAGEFRLRRVLPPERCEFLVYGSELANAFLNINRPEDQKRAEVLLRA